MAEQRVAGVLTIHADGYGFIRNGQFAAPNDGIYVSIATIRRHRLASGDHIDGTFRWPQHNERYASMTLILGINGEDAERARARQT